METSSSLSKFSINDNINTILLRIILSNGENIIDDERWIEPILGERIEIISWDEQIDVQECIKLSRFPFLTIKDIFPIIIGIGNEKYAWAYNVEVEETERNIVFSQFTYKLLKS